MADVNAQELIAKVDEARAAYMDETFEALLDVVEELGDDPKASAILTRGRERLLQGQRMKFHDNDYIEKVLPDVMLAYQFIGGRTPEVWEVIRHLIWQERHAAALNEFTYLLEQDLWDLVAT
jgi:hypothetical protein